MISTVFIGSLLFTAEGKVATREIKNKMYRYVFHRLNCLAQITRFFKAAVPLFDTVKVFRNYRFFFLANFVRGITSLSFNQSEILSQCLSELQWVTEFLVSSFSQISRGYSWCCPVAETHFPPSISMETMMADSQVTDSLYVLFREHWRLAI